MTDFWILVGHASTVNRKPLQIRTAETSADWQIAHSLLDDEHLFGAGRKAGDRLCQFILKENEIVAVLRPAQRPAEKNSGLNRSPRTPALCCAPRKFRRIASGSKCQAMMPSSPPIHSTTRNRRYESSLKFGGILRA